MAWWDYLLLLGAAIVLVIGLNLLGWWQATRGMTEEQKEKLLKYWEDHPGCGMCDDDDDL